jgi:peptide/nickel transport system permease protein
MFRILPTDIFVYLLLAAIFVFILSARRKEYWRTAWRQVRKNPVAMISLVILVFYTSIAILDTIHYEDKKTGITLSLLDWIAAPLREQVEKTYSTPFATHLYTKEMVDTIDGEPRLIYPRLTYGGSHLTKNNYRIRDITRRLGTACAGGGIVALILTGIIISIYNFFSKSIFPKTQISDNRVLSRRAVFTITLLTFSITFLIILIVNLSPYYHLLGTDKVGYDVFYRSLKSIRTGLVIGSVTTLIVIPFAIIFGVLAGYWGGLLDDIIQYIYSTLASIPSVLLIVSFMLLVEIGESVDDIAWRADRRLLSLCIIMGITSWTGLCRLIRGETLKLRELDYVQAALSFGVSRLSIIAKHIVPNLMHIVLISFILRFSGLVLAEAVLAYIGIGVDPSMESWGNMINTARLELAREPVVWWNLFAAFIFMFGLVLPANLFGDALRDALDPRLKT